MGKVLVNRLAAPMTVLDRKREAGCDVRVTCDIRARVV